MLSLMREGCSYTYPTLSIARYSFIQLSELEQCKVKKRAQGFNTAAQDSNPKLSIDAMTSVVFEKRYRSLIQF